MDLQQQQHPQKHHHQQRQQLEQRADIEQFLFDVRDHFRASLETSEYENTSNIFHMTAAEATANLLQRCEQLLGQCAAMHRQKAHSTPHINGVGAVTDSRYAVITMSNGTNASAATKGKPEEVSYLDMSANNKKKSGSREYIAFNNSADSDKTFRCSTRLSGQRVSCMRTDPTDVGGDSADDENDDADRQIYDICQVSQVDTDETLQTITAEMEFTQTIDCPYIELPAGHLTIQKSAKYGQLQRIEKRLFFDQSKKYYCGILNDWLLCYADGPTSPKPTITLHLKSNGIEIEHSGEGKRREICFQITTADPNKKFLFQATNEVDAKEWIHAVETAIRSDSSAMMKNARKLPTPPMLKKITFVTSHQNGSVNGGANVGPVDCIYEEPSPLYDMHEPTELLIGKRTEAKPPELPDKVNNSIAMADKFEYDVPKCPPQPLKSTDQSPIASDTAILLNNSETNTSTNGPNGSSTPKSDARTSEKLEFQTKVKDVHSKLSSQLSVGTNSERLKKVVKKTYSACSSNEAEAIALTPPTSANKEQKKQKKSNTPTASPQKTNNSKDSNGSNSSSNEKSAKNWFLNRLNKTTSSARSSSIATPAKCKQSEKENLLNSLELCDSYEGAELSGSNPASPILKSGAGGKSKVNMIINQFEASGISVAVASFTSFCDNDCNNYEPIMTVSTPPNSFMKKV